MKEIKEKSYYLQIDFPVRQRKYSAELGDGSSRPLTSRDGDGVRTQVRLAPKRLVIPLLPKDTTFLTRFSFKASAQVLPGFLDLVFPAWHSRSNTPTFRVGGGLEDAFLTLPVGEQSRL